jgi:hypothetical protein
MLRVLFLAACIAGSFSSYAQDSIKIAQASKLIPRHTIKFSPMHLLNFYPTVQLAYEVKASTFLTFQFDGGVIIDNGFDDEEIQDKKGFKVKVEPHYYFAFSERRSLAFYQALELYWNNVHFYTTTEQTECFDAECQHQFRRTYFYKMNYREYGAAIKIGLVKHFRPFLFDVNAGFGMRIIDYEAPSYIKGRLDSDFFDVPRIEDRVTPTPIINFRLGYSFPTRRKPH